MTLEDAIVYTALSYVGVSADPQEPEARERFEGLMGYGETAGMKRDMSSHEKASTCGLFVRGLLWLVFHQFLSTVDMHEIAPPYAGPGNSNLGKVFKNLEDLTSRCNALHDWLPGMWPEPADIVMVGLDTRFDGHTYVVTGRDGNVIEAVDAGQKRKKGGYQCVRAKAHTWTPQGRYMSDHAAMIGESDIFPGADRHVSKIIRMAELKTALLGNAA